MIEFLAPISKQTLAHREILPVGTLGKQIEVHAEKGELPNLKNVQFALMGIKENRGDENFIGGDISFDLYRKALYSLYPGNWNHNIIDLGDIDKGETANDTRFAAKEVIAALLKKGITPLILAAGQDLAYAQYRAFDGIADMVNVVNVDSRFDLGNAELPLSNKSYVGKMVVDKPYNLFNYSVLGYQSFYNAPQEIALLDKLFFEAYRLGEVCSDLTSVEPIMRDADMVTIDVTAIKNADLSYKSHESPNGFDGREICAIARYAGISNKVKSFGVYELSDTVRSQSGPMLVAQLLWYFIEGYNFRVNDGDFEDDQLFTTYKVPIEDVLLEFKKSNKTERWWIVLPFLTNVNNKLKRGTLLPCTYGEYLGACNQEIPDRWLKARQKNEV